MVIDAGVVVACLVLAAIAGRLVFDRVARRRHWRVGGRWSDVLPGWDERRYERCRRCGTSSRYVPLHGLPYEEVDRRNATRRNRWLAAICQPCHVELGTPAARIPYYEAAWELMVADDQAHGRETNVADLVSIRAAVRVGL